jgi:hypothetical protein
MGMKKQRREAEDEEENGADYVASRRSAAQRCALNWVHRALRCRALAASRRQ